MRKDYPVACMVWVSIFVVLYKRLVNIDYCSL